MSSGPEVVHGWINCLLSQETLIQPETVTKADPHQAVAIPPPKRIKSETPPPVSWATNTALQRPTSFPSQTYNSPSAQPPSSSSASHVLPPRMNKPTPANPLAPAQPQAAFLPLFSQAAAKRKVSVEYLAEFSGPLHAGRWAVKCIGKWLNFRCGSQDY